MIKNNEINRNVPKSYNRVTRASVKTLPELVFAPFSCEEGSTLVMKLPWRNRSEDMNISINVKTNDFGVFTTDSEYDMETLDQMPHYSIYITVSITSSTLRFNTSYELIFNPYEEREIEFIRNISKSRCVISIYDKLANPISEYEIQGKYSDETLNDIYSYPLELRKTGDVVAYRRIYNPDTVIYSIDDFRHVRSKYAIKSTGTITSIPDSIDYKHSCNHICYNETYNFIGQLKELGIFNLLTDVKKDIFSLLDSTEINSRPIVINSFIEYIYILDKYAADGKLAVAMNEMAKLAHRCSTIEFIAELVTFLERVDIKFDKSQIPTGNLVSTYLLIAELMHHFWILVYTTHCLCRTDNKFAYVRPNGDVHEYRLPEFSSLSEAYRYFEILSLYMGVMGMVVGFERLIKDSESFVDIKAYQHIPTIKDGKQTYQEYIRTAVKNKRYIITEPLEVSIDARSGIKSITLYEPSQWICTCKISFSDNKVTFLVIDSLNFEIISFCGMPKNFSELTNTLACYCCAVYKDLSVVETHVLEKTMKVTSPMNLSEPIQQSRIVYLPKVKRTHLDSPPAQEPKDQSNSVSGKTLPRAAHDVVCHFRRIKHSASQRQIELARLVGIEVPEGFTFVRQHKRSGIAKKRIFRSRSALQLLQGGADRNAHQPNEDAVCNG